MHFVPPFLQYHSLLFILYIPSMFGCIFRHSGTFHTNVPFGVILLQGIPDNSLFHWLVCTPHTDLIFHRSTTFCSIRVYSINFFLLSISIPHSIVSCAWLPRLPSFILMAIILDSFPVLIIRVTGPYSDVVCWLFHSSMWHSFISFHCSVFILTLFRRPVLTVDSFILFSIHWFYHSVVHVVFNIFVAFSIRLFGGWPSPFDDIRKCIRDGIRFSPLFIPSPFRWRSIYSVLHFCCGRPVFYISHYSINIVLIFDILHWSSPVSLLTWAGEPPGMFCIRRYRWPSILMQFIPILYCWRRRLAPATHHTYCPHFT